MSAPRTISNSSVNLCTKCQDGLLLDNSEEVEVETDGTGSKILLIEEDAQIPTDYSLLDKLPDLPKLQASADQGCQLCALLRKAVMSNEAAQTLKRHFGLEIGTLHGKDILLNIVYRFNCPTGPSDSSFRNYIEVSVGITDTYHTDDAKSNDSGSIAEVKYFQAQLSIICAIEATAVDDAVAKWLGLNGPSALTYIDEKSVRWMKSNFYHA